jgi:hypothetical protein
MAVPVPRIRDSNVTVQSVSVVTGTAVQICRFCIVSRCEGKFGMFSMFSKVTLLSLHCNYVRNMLCAYKKIYTTLSSTVFI